MTKNEINSQKNKRQQKRHKSNHKDYRIKIMRAPMRTVFVIL